MRIEHIFIPSAMIWVGVITGYLPIWTGIFAFAAAGIFSAVEGLKLGIAEESSEITAHENITSQWLKNLHQQEQTRSRVQQSWNCKNCGGPNVNKIQCQYCGMVKE